MSTSSSASKPAGQWQPPTLEEMQAMLPQYQFISLLGRGGMGAVYKAVQISLDRAVAIKVLPADLIDDTDAQFAERFKNEARTMARMSHPSIVNVWEFGETNTGLLYIVMEFINGTDVEQMIRAQGRLPEDYALSITAHVSDALQYAHTHGVIHRDIKPANILINMEGAVKVADFGLAKANDAGQSGITKTNMAMGTPDFVAPEALIPGIPLDGRADLYAMGVMLYQMLTGEIPRGIWTMPSAKLGTDPRFDGIIAKAMQPDRELRYQSAAELRQDLDTMLTLPRAALIQQQQAAAEATARATQAQKQQVASGPQRRPIRFPHPEAPAPVKKRSSRGPFIGIVATIVLVAGLAYMLKPPAKKPGTQSTAQSASLPKPPNASIPAPVPKSAPAPTPAPNGSASFSNFAPAAQWRDELVGTETWGPAWQRADRELHIVEGKKAMRIFADLRKDAGLRVRFRSRSATAFLDLVQRFKRDENGRRYVITLSTKERLDGSLDIIPPKEQGERRTLAPLKGHPPLGIGTEHTAELYAIGDRLTFFFDGQLLGETRDSTFTDGLPGVFADHGIELIQVETAVLNGPTWAPPPVEVLAFGGHRYQFSPEKLNWDEAKAKAAATGGHLATITREEENQWVLDTFVTKLPAGLSLWLGGTNDNPSRTWTWITGEPFTFTAWGAGEPGTNLNEIVLCFSQMNKGWGDIRNDGVGAADRRGGYLIEWDDDDSGKTPPVMPATPASALGDAVDLLALVDVKRDVVVGPWEMTSEGLALKWEKGRAVNVLEFNYSAPEEYDFEIEFTIKKGLSDVSQLLPVKGRTVRWKMGHGFVPLYSFGPNLDGKRADDSERTEAIVKRAHLKSGQRYRSAVQVRKGSLRALIDGEEILRWSGDLERLGNEASTTVKDGAHPGLGSYSAFVIFHSAVVRPAAGGAPVPTPAMPAVASAPTTAVASAAGNAPTSAPPVPPTDPHLAKLEAGFKARYESDAQKPYLAAVTALDKSYVSNGIARARADAQSKGRLDEVVALDEFKARVERGEGVPDVDEPGTPESLKSLRAIYRSALAKITAERDTRAALLYDLYVKALDAYIAELTRGGKISEAQTVETFREDIARQRPTPDKPTAAPVVVQAQAPPVPAEPAAPVASTGSTWRSAAEWLVAGRGSAVVVKGGQRIQIKTAEDIPSGRFDFDEITIRGNGATLKLTDADMAVLNGLRGLRRVLVRAEGLTDAGFAFLAGNADLEFLAIEVSTAVTDGLLAHLADAKKLREIRVQGAKEFTGRGMERAPFLDALQVVSFNDSGITDDGLQALSSCRHLTSINLLKTRITDAGGAALGEFKELAQLDVEGTGFGDGAAAAIAGLRGLRSINLEMTKITEAGLANFYALKTLTDLRIRRGNPQLGLGALTELQKSMPGCKVH